MINQFLLSSALLSAVALSSNSLGDSYNENAVQSRDYVITNETGCTCNGWSWDNSPTSAVVFTNISFAAHPGWPNPVGWCFVDGVMTPFLQEQITDAVDLGPKGAMTNYVNTTTAWQYCDYYGDTTKAKCAAAIILGTSNQMGSPAIVWQEGCSYPPSNFYPTSCQECTWECAAGYTACGTNCIDTTKSCVSGIPVAHSRRRNTPDCPMGYDICRTPRGGWECLDTKQDLEACGGCPHEGGVDCSGLPNVSSVECRLGKCIVSACNSKHSLFDNECIAD